MPRLLLVEDEQVNREMFRRRLGARGFEMFTAESGEQAIELALRELPDLVLMDLGLPGIDGWEATRQLKANPATATIPVIALSAHATSDAKEKAFTAGCVDFETKPVQMDRLVEKVNKAIAARVKSAPSPAAPAAEPPAAPNPEHGTQTASNTDTGLPDGLGSPGPAGQKRVLVVEDNDANRVMLCRRLNKQGFATTEARDGREALQLVRVYRFDLVLCDIMMPEVDGYQVLEALKGDPDLKALPVIMISALDEMASVVRCIEMGAEDYLQKPYDPVLLQARINACLDKRRLRDQELAYLRAVSDLTKAAVAVEKGAFDPLVLAPVAARDDALGVLARIFDKMAREVQARETQLRQEVQRLQVEIDQTRKDAQVKEITEDGFFQELQQRAIGLQKAAGLRRRTRKDPKDPKDSNESKDPPIPTGDTQIFPKLDLGLPLPPPAE